MIENPNWDYEREWADFCQFSWNVGQYHKFCFKELTHWIAKIEHKGYCKQIVEYSNELIEVWKLANFVKPAIDEAGRFEYVVTDIGIDALQKF